MEYKITGYEPAKLFHYFEEISAIPRESGNEKGISDYLVAFAKEHGLWFYQDDVYNVIIKKAASTGAEAAPAVMLQGHIDMVCDKLGTVEHDFTKDGIDLVVKDGVLTANGTTLGADNGIAVALMLTVLDDDTLAHPALECVFTTDEESGLVGAETLDKSQIDARIMINLDSEEEGVATVSCAGGVVVTYTRPAAREHKAGSLLTLEISGLFGGHSGADIHLERGNGNLIMARIVERLMIAGEPALVSFNGGTKDNAINRECKAELVYADHAAAEAGAELAREIAAKVAAELETYDPGFTCDVAVADDAEVEAIDEDTALAFVRAIRLAPNGVMRRQPRGRRRRGRILQHRRGTHAPADEVRRSCCRPVPPSPRCRRSSRTACRRSPTCWASMPSSSLSTPAGAMPSTLPCANVFVDTYRELFDSELRIESIHAGLECGLFAEALDGLDAIAVGPTLKDVHTPDESMELASSERFYQLLVAVLKRLAS